MLYIFSKLAGLELTHVTPESWPGIAEALPALTALSSLTLGVRDIGDDADGEGDVSTSPLSSLASLRLPKSVAEFTLLYTLPSCRNALTIDGFGSFGHVTGLWLSVNSNEETVTEMESEHMKLSLGPSLSALSSLQHLSVRARGTLEQKVAYVFPPAFSCLTSLTRFSAEGSTGRNVLPAVPQNWNPADFDLKGANVLSRLSGSY